MDAAELKRRIAAAREFEFVVDGGITLRCRAPSNLEMRTALRAADVDGRVDWDAVIRALTPGCVIGWKGVSRGLFLDDLPLEEAAQGVEFSADLVMELFARRVDLFDAVAARMLDQYETQRARLKDSIKN